MGRNASVEHRAAEASGSCPRTDFVLHPHCPEPWCPALPIPRWRLFDYLVFGPNWGSYTPLISLLVLMGVVLGVGLIYATLAEVFGWPRLFAPWIFAPLPIPIAWMATRGMVRGHDKSMLRAAEAKGCGTCGYAGHGRDPNRCPECGPPMDRSWWEARLWLERI